MGSWRPSTQVQVCRARAHIKPSSVPCAHACWPGSWKQAARGRAGSTSQGSAASRSGALGGGRGVYNNPSVPQGRGRWPGTPRPSPPHRVDSVCPSRLGLASPLTHILLEWAEAALGRGHPSPFLPGTLWSQTRLFCREASIPVLGAACPKLAGACEVPAWKRPPPPRHSCVRRRVCAPDPRNSPTISGLWPWRAG